MSRVKDKGLKRNAILFLSNLMIGIASAAPAYSLASALGSIAGIAAFATPAILAIAFIPMLFVSVAYFYRGVSIAWYVGLTILSKNVLSDSILALGLCIAFYYALTAFACPVFYRGELLRSPKNFMLMGVLPIAGSLMMVFLFVRSCLALSSAGPTTILGLTVPLAIGAGSLLSGVALMILAQWRFPDFFRKTPEEANLT